VRYAFRVAYDGSRYFGFVKQPSRPTIEAELLKAFKRCGLYRELKKVRVRTASRTDRGVSAVGQVVALNVFEEPNLSLINACLPDDIAVLAVAEVESEFDPRRQAQNKHYRYVCEAPLNFDLSLAHRAAKLLNGIHNFKYLCKHEQGRSTLGNIKYASVRGREILVFDFIARAFLWQQVRRMVNVLLAVGKGKLNLDELKKMLEGEAKQAMRPAPAEGLILVGIRYPSLVLKPDARTVSKFIKYLRERAHPSYKAMERILLSTQ